MNPTREEVIAATLYYEPELFQPGSLVAQVRLSPEGPEIMTDEGWQGFGNGTGRVICGELPEYTAPRERMGVLDFLAISVTLAAMWFLLAKIVIGAFS